MDEITAPEGMIVLDAPEGFAGYVLAPDPEGWLSARSIAKWAGTEIPPELTEEAWLYQEAYARAHLVQFHLVDGKGRKVVINEKALRTMSYPHVCASIIVEATESLISQARNKKK